MGEHTGFTASREIRGDRLIHDEERMGSKIRTGVLQNGGDGSFGRVELQCESTQVKK